MIEYVFIDANLLNWYSSANLGKDCTSLFSILFWIFFFLVNLEVVAEDQLGPDNHPM
jgi:hypothetical protein